MLEVVLNLKMEEEKIEENIAGWEPPKEKEVKPEKKKKKQRGNYIFPNVLASAMRGISQRTQYEAEMMSTSVILIGIIITTIVTVFFTDYGLMVKILAVINMGAAWVFLWARLVTSIQQYHSFLQAIGLLNDWNGEENEN